MDLFNLVDLVDSFKFVNQLANLMVVEVSYNLNLFSQHNQEDL